MDGPAPPIDRRLSSGRGCRKELLGWWCPPGMPLLVSPDLTLYRVDDESALSALAKAVGPDFPRLAQSSAVGGVDPFERVRAELG